MVNLFSVLLQDPSGEVLPRFFEYGAIGLVALVAIGLYLMERKERLKIQEEKNALYLEMANNKKELERILDELKSL